VLTPVNTLSIIYMVSTGQKKDQGLRLAQQ